jgi:hypothetical protein
MAVSRYSQENISTCHFVHPPQTPLKLPWTQTRTFAMRSRQLRPELWDSLNFKHTFLCIERTFSVPNPSKCTSRHIYQILVFMRRCEDGIRVDLRELRGLWSGFSWLWTETGGGLLWTLWWTFGFWRHGVRLLSFAETLLMHSSYTIKKAVKKGVRLL